MICCKITYALQGGDIIFETKIYIEKLNFIRENICLNSTNTEN